MDNNRTHKRKQKNYSQAWLATVWLVDASLYRSLTPLNITVNRLTAERNQDIWLIDTKVQIVSFAQRSVANATRSS